GDDGGVDTDLNRRGLEWLDLALGVELIEVLAVVAATEDDDLVNGAVMRDVVVRTHRKLVREPCPLVLLLAKEMDRPAQDANEPLPLREIGDGRAVADGGPGDFWKRLPFLPCHVVAMHQPGGTLVHVEDTPGRVDGVVVVGVADRPLPRSGVALPPRWRLAQLPDVGPRVVTNEFQRRGVPLAD